MLYTEMPIGIHLTNSKNQFQRIIREFYSLKMISCGIKYSPQGGDMVEVYDFGLRLKELRESKKLSQKDVAMRLNVVPSTISGYESNTVTPSLEQFTRMAILYNASLDYMMGLDNRSCFYLDGLSKDQQQAILDVVNRLKCLFLQEKQ